MEQFVLALLHYNIQYCAGGVDGLLENPDFPQDAASIEDQIIVESLVPILDLLEAHPTWGMNFEMQAYMVEVMAARHPEALAQMRDLAHAGQAEIMSFHYSDQLWTAYTWADQARSLDLVADVFATHDLPLSGVVFNQEGQFGPGMLQRMGGHGYDVAILPRNLATYTWGGEIEHVLYTSDGVFVLPTSNGTSDDGSYSLQWSFVDDGELLATNNANPYMGQWFVHDPVSLAAYEEGVLALEAGGAQIATIGAFIEAVGDRGAAPLPPTIDGTWQPDNTDNLALWMGGSGAWEDTEQDNTVLTTNVKTSRLVRAAELVAPESADVDEAWRLALLGQVSDSTGWNPYPTEVAYSLDHAAEASALAREVLDAHCLDVGAEELHIDLGAGTVSADGDVPAPPTPIDPPASAWLPTLEGRTHSVAWAADATDPRVTHGTVTWSNPGDRVVSMSFPWDGVDMQTIPALLDDELLAFVPADSSPDPMHIPLPSGLVHLHDEIWLLMDVSTVHLAAAFHRGEQTISFTDHWVAAEDVPWSFQIFEGGAEDAMALARAVNLAPSFTHSCPAPVAGDGGCGCATGGSHREGLGLLGLIGLLAWRRRREGCPVG